MKLPLYNTEGKELKQIELSDEVFGLKWNADLVHMVVTAILGNNRDNIANTKTRAEVSGGGKKPWKQKGTGRARHGSTRSPIWVGGGISFGPRSDRNFDRKINKKMKAAALATVLSQKIRDNQLILVDSVKFDEPKTKNAKSIIESLAKISGFEKINRKYANAAVVGLSGRDENIEKSFSNFNNVFVDEVRNFNPAVLMNYKFVVILNAEESLKTLDSRLNKNNK